MIAAFISSIIVGVYFIGNLLTGIFIFLPFFLLLAIPVSLFVDWYSNQRRVKRIYLIKLSFYGLSGITMSCIVVITFGITGDFATVNIPSVFLITLFCSLIYYHFLLLLKMWLKWYESVPLSKSK